MTRIGTLREAFDRAMDFEAAKEFKFDGKVFVPGQSFPKTLTTTRGLRQLYDSRRLCMVLPEEQQFVREPRPVHKFEIGNMLSEDERRSEPEQISEPEPKAKVGRVKLKRQA